MRTLFLALVAGGLCAQAPGPIPNDALREAAKPVEAWMGTQLAIYTGVPSEPIPAQRLPLFPQPFDAREALITPNRISVSLTRILAFRSGQELAEFLAHAAAHAKLGHPARMAQVMTEVAILDTTHAPQRIASTLETRTRAEMEEAAAPVAAELLRSSGCAPGPCQMFGLLLRAARQAATP